jgi:hypothetical protein
VSIAFLCDLILLVHAYLYLYTCVYRYNMATRAAPFESLNVGDVGDIAINTFNLQKSIDIITKHFRSKIDRVLNLG